MRASLLLATFLFSGCAPLQQAPLMYTSKQVLGVDISAPTTESTGVTMNLGFKNVDAAYVPIAVSKEGDTNSVNLVKATFGSRDEGKGSSDELQTSWINNLNAAILAEQTAQNNLKAADANYEVAQQYNNSISSGNTSEAQALAKSAAFKSLNALKIRTFTSQNEPIPQNEIDVLKQEQANAQQKLKETTADLEQAKRKVADSLSIQREDAMSVYGSFGSSTGTDSTSINNKLGKMFSTGVAAQNLTEGIAREGQAHAAGQLLAKCMEISKSLDEPTKKKFLTDCVKAMSTD